MTLKLKSIFLAISLLLLGTAILHSGSVFGLSSPAPSNELLSLLPQSDAVAIVDVRRLMAEAVPLALTGDPTGLAKVNSQLDRFKVKSGLDPRKWDQVAIGARETSPHSIDSSDVVVIARGSIDTAAIAAVGTVAPNGKYNDGVIIYLVNVDDDTKNMKSKPLAVAIIDQSTVVMGELTIVKQTVEGRSGAPRNAELISLVNRSPNACFSFGANVPAHLTDGMNLPSDDIAKNINSIRQVYGSMNMGSSQIDVFAAAKTHNGDEAQSLSATLTSLKDFASMMSSQLGADRAKMAQSAIENLKIEKSGDEVQIKLSIPQTDVVSLLQSLTKKKATS